MSSDQYNKADGGKVRPSLLFLGMPLALEHVSAVLTYGAEKYEDDGWKNVAIGRYQDAKFRHILNDAKEEVYDEESGLLHAAHEACNALFILHQKLEQLGNPKPKWNTPDRSHRAGGVPVLETGKDLAEKLNKISEHSDLLGEFKRGLYV